MVRRLSLPRIVRVLFEPARVFAELARSERGFDVVFALLALEVVLIHPLEIAHHAGVMAVDPFGGLAGLASFYVRYALQPVLLLLAAGAVTYVALRRVPAPPTFWGAAAVAAHAWAPHTLVVAAGVLVSAVGVDSPLSPNRPLGALSSGALILRVAIELGWTGALVVFAHFSLRRGGQPAPPPPTRRAAAPVTIAVSVVVLGALGLTAATVARGWSEARPLMPGDPLPAFTVRALDGGRALRAQDVVGAVTLVDFWATWCPPCVAAMPHLAELHRELSPRGLRTLSVNVEPEAPDLVRSFAAEHELPFDVWVDGGSAQRAFRIRTFPTVVILDADGTVRRVHVGNTSITTLRRDIEELLKTAAAPR